MNNLRIKKILLVVGLVIFFSGIELSYCLSDTKTSESKVSEHSISRTQKDKIFFEMFNGLLTVTIGIMVAFISYQQYVTNRNRLDHEKREFQFRHSSELFDRRLAIFKTVNSTLSSILQKGHSEPTILLSLLRDTQERHFLFEKEIDDYVNQIYTRGIELNSNHRELSEGGVPVGERRTELAKKNTDLLMWFGNQFDIAREKFSRYLTLHTY